MRLSPYLASILTKYKDIFDRQIIFILIIGVITTVMNLIITLDLIASIVVAILFMALAVFSRSFSKGWLFLLGVSLLFPTIEIGKNIFLFDLFLFILVVISLIQFTFENNQFFIDKISFNFFLFLLVGASLVVFSYIFNGSVYQPIWRVALSFLLMWMLLFVFQYFFQTIKRIRRFLLLVVLIGVVHSFFGIIAFIFNWQVFSSMGIVIGKHGGAIFGLIKKQISGFLGIGLGSTVGHNFLATFLVISILSTLGMIMYYNKMLSKKKSKNAKKYEVIFLILLAIQSIGIILTFSYSSLISVSLGALIIGIIIRNNRIIIPSAVLIIIFTVFVPRFFPSFNTGALTNFSNINKITEHWIMGNGIIFEKSKANVISGDIYNSYLFIWNYYGILGLGILVSMFYKFFLDIYLSYKKSQGQERLLLTVAVGIFIALLLEGFSGNVLIFGPTAVIFWLIYAVVLNLKNNLIPVSFIMKSGLFTNNLGFFSRKKVKSIDGIRKKINNGAL